MCAEVIHGEQSLINGVEKCSIGASAAVQGSYDRHFIKHDLSSFSPNGLDSIQISKKPSFFDK